MVCFHVNMLTSSLLTLAYQVRSCCKGSATLLKALYVLCFTARKPPASLTSLMLPITLNNSGFLRSRSIIRNRHPNLTSLINNIIPFLLRLSFFTPPSIYEFHKSCWNAGLHYALPSNPETSAAEFRSSLSKAEGLECKAKQILHGKIDWWFSTFIHKTIYIHLYFAMRQISLLFERSLLSVSFSWHLQIGMHFPWADRKRKIAFLLLVSSY